MNGKISKDNDGWALIGFNKSGVTSKLGLDVGACIIDFTYEGEIHLNVINTSTKSVRIYEDMKLVQFIEVPIKVSKVEVVDKYEKDNEFDISKEGEEFFKNRKKDRLDKGFGSSDKE